MGYNPRSMSFLGNALGAGPNKTEQQANNLLNFNAQDATRNSQQARDTGMNFLANFHNTLGAPANYFQRLLSGDKTLMSQAVAPTANAISSQYDAARRTVNQNMPRGGFSSVLQAELPFQKAKATGDLFSILQPAAAQGLMGIAGMEGQVGGNLMNTGLGYFGEGTRAAGLLGQLAGGQQDRAFKAGSGIGGLLGQLLEPPDWLKQKIPGWGTNPGGGPGGPGTTGPNATMGGGGTDSSGLPNRQLPYWWPQIAEGQGGTRVSSGITYGQPVQYYPGYGYGWFDDIGWFWPSPPPGGGR